MIFVDDTAHIVLFALVVEDGVALQRKIRSVPRISVIDGGSDNVDPENQ